MVRGGWRCSDGRDSVGKSENPPAINCCNLTEMLHVLGEQTDMKTELYQTKVKSQRFIYRASFQHRLHYLMHVVRD